ncbi:MAG: SHOCT domain-containing protein [Gaiellaceae bacterium]|jgi:hypothetical protein
MVATTFWESFFLFLIFIPLAMVWGFAVLDIFRRDDIGGFSKAMWVLCVIVLPLFGSLIYLIARPVGATLEEREVLESADRGFSPAYGPSNGLADLSALADLHDRGKVTDAEFAAEKARLLGTGSPMPA